MTGQIAIIRLTCAVARPLKALVPLALLLAYSGHAAAALLLFNDRTAWQTAVGTSTSSEDFNSVVTDTEFWSADLTVGLVTLSSNAGTNPVFDNDEALVNVSPFGPGSGGIDGTALVDSLGLDGGEYIEITVPTLSTAFGFDFENYDGGGANDGLEILVNGMSVATLGAGSGFLGFTTDMGAFDTVRFLSNSTDGPENGTFNAIDNIEWNSVTVPEPATTALMGLALLGMGAASRKRRTR